MSHESTQSIFLVFFFLENVDSKKSNQGRGEMSLTIMLNTQVSTVFTSFSDEFGVLIVRAVELS